MDMTYLFIIKLNKKYKNAHIGHSSIIKSNQKMRYKLKKLQIFKS